MGKQCLFSFRKIASSNNSDVGLVTFLESGCRALTLVLICGVLLKEGGVTGADLGGGCRGCATPPPLK